GEVAVMGGDESARVEGGRRRLLRAPDRVAITRERVGDGILDEDEEDGVVTRAWAERTVGQDDGHPGMGGDSRPHSDEEREMPAARLADEPDARGIDTEAACVSAHPSHPRRHVGTRRRMLVVRPLPEVQGGYD